MRFSAPGSWYDVLMVSAYLTGSTLKLSSRTSGILEEIARFAIGMTAFFLGLLAFSDKDVIPALSAADSLAKGYAESYHQESLHRISLLTMEGVDEVWVPNFSVVPPLLDEQYLSTDPSDYRNQAVAKWFGVSILHMSEIY